MMDIIEEWRSSLIRRPAIRFPQVAMATGARIAHLGPRSDFARVRLRFEPADQFTASIDAIANDPDSRSFARAALFGSLDVLVTFAKYPVLKVHVIVEQMDIDSINSNELAFRLAGRDATRKALEQYLTL